MTITLSPRSVERLSGAHPDLAKVVMRAAAISDLDFTVLEVLRTLDRQKELVAKGASETMRSRHLPGTNGKSHAVDIAPMIGGQVSWDWPLYHKLAEIIKRAAHWQLPWKAYP
jgi:peptidoglycan L-alanyl-D-glutamate endopeptidase CwlK